MNLTIRQIVEATGGRLIYDEGREKDSLRTFLEMQVDSVVLDSRQVTEGGVFVATVGERVDGHTFITSAFEKGIALAIVQRKPEEAETWKRYLLVENTPEALKKIAECYRKNLNIPVIGITGSVGKTSTKEFIAGVLSVKYNVLKTQGNYNNEIGVPLTLLRIRPEHEVAVVEMGISDFGEMHRLSKMARPDIAVITNIGQCHLENLIDRDGVLKAKTELFDFMSEKGRICLNGEDDKLATISDVSGRELFFFGRNRTEKTSVYTTEVTEKGLWGSDALLHNIGGDRYEIEVPLPGSHMVLNAAAAACVAELLGLTPAQIQAGMKKVETIGGRNHLIRTEKRTLIDDCYNANPVSMKAGIDLLCMADTPKVAILGDMFELGEGSEKMHGEIGAYAANKEIDRIVCVGVHSRSMHEEALKYNKKSSVMYFSTLEELLSRLREAPEEIVPDGSTVLIKASHGMHFDRVVEVLK
ncbi:MAG: UDP-N-acetylmuramoyl-tripeptide--D-alanyl-D-alanine ligase [Lachnospiraceae bacterium]|nr:UDP-N-acetylmuramoyl-tripeptide--D-alanyl-D-alanine ligase [Lachnospiraceae bacterium]